MSLAKVSCTEHARHFIQMKAYIFNLLCINAKQTKLKFIEYHNYPLWISTMRGSL